MRNVNAAAFCPLGAVAEGLGEGDGAAGSETRESPPPEQLASSNERAARAAVARVERMMVILIVSY
jgi:hypothetical protein